MRRGMRRGQAPPQEEGGERERVPGKETLQPARQGPPSSSPRSGLAGVPWTPLWPHPAHIAPRNRSPPDPSRILPRGVAEGAGPWTGGQGSARGGSERRLAERAVAPRRRHAARPRRQRRARGQRRDSRGAPPARPQPRRRETGVSRPDARPRPGSRLQAQTPHLLAVVVARNRLPPRTTSACPHSASPTEVAMSPAGSRADTHVGRPAPLPLAPESDVTRRRPVVT